MPERHVVPFAQVPQLIVRVTPQLSVAVTSPQVLFKRAQNPASLSATQTHWLLALQSKPFEQPPQFVVLPHSLVTVPHWPG